MAIQASRLVRPGWSPSCSACSTGLASPARCARSDCRERDIPLALLFFNVGVEAGQLLFIAGVVALFALAGRFLPSGGKLERGPWRTEALIRTPVAYVVGSISAFWVVQRVVAFWG